MPTSLVSKSAEQDKSELWFRLSQKPSGWNQIPPSTGKEILKLPNAWPQPEIPMWRNLEYRDKLPLPNWHNWKLSVGKMCAGFIPKWKGALFDLWDPNHILYDTEYHILTDPALRCFCKARRKRLLQDELITENDEVRVGLKEYNQWRSTLFRYQRQLVMKKQAMAKKKELCKLLKGFIHAITSKTDMKLKPESKTKSKTQQQFKFKGKSKPSKKRQDTGYKKAKQILHDIQSLMEIIESLRKKTGGSTASGANFGDEAAKPIDNQKLLEELVAMRNRVTEHCAIQPLCNPSC